MPAPTTRWSRLLLVLACIGLAACGSPTAEEAAAGGDATADQPTAEGDAEGDAEASPSPAGATAAAGSPIEALQAELEGLDDDARRERLLEIAQDEDGSLQFYTSMNSDQATA